jgi:hypothetical protein
MAESKNTYITSAVRKNEKSVDLPLGFAATSRNSNRTFRGLDLITEQHLVMPGDLRPDPEI